MYQLLLVSKKRVFNNIKIQNFMNKKLTIFTNLNFKLKRKKKMLIIIMITEAVLRKIIIILIIIIVYNHTELYSTY